MKKSKLSIRRMAINAVMIAIYVILSTYFTIPLGGLKITIEALPVILCALLFGPVDGAIVGGLAEFMNQLLTFGITPTTVDTNLGAEQEYFIIDKEMYNKRKDLLYTGRTLSILTFIIFSSISPSELMVVPPSTS